MMDNVEVRAYMNEAIEEAKLGLKEGGIPIGSVLVRAGKILGKEGTQYAAPKE
jgi:cytosine deaminase